MIGDDEKKLAEIRKRLAQPDPPDRTTIKVGDMPWLLALLDAEREKSARLERVVRAAEAWASVASIHDEAETAALLEALAALAPPLP